MNGVKVGQSLEGLLPGSTTVRLAVAGDVCPIGAIGEALVQGLVNEVFGDLCQVLSGADLAVANLECPLIDAATPIAKAGPVLGAPVACAAAIRAAGFHILGLANNHVLDHGRRGLSSTLSACRTAGIRCVGAGLSEAEACQYLIREVNGLRIGIVAMAEAEFCLASGSYCGACHLDSITFGRMARTLRAQSDFVLVLVHGGNEGYPYPRPGLQRLCRYLVEEGANAVLCQHSHCLGCYEEYQGGLILYGQGNMLFPASRMTEVWRMGSLLDIEVGPGRRFKWRLLLTQQATRWVPGQPYLTFVDPMSVVGRRLSEDLQERNLVLADASRLESDWSSFCASRKRLVWNRVLARGRVQAWLNRFGLLDFLVPGPQRQKTLNAIRCESHREAFLEVAESEWRATSERDAACCARREDLPCQKR